MVMGDKIGEVYDTHIQVSRLMVSIAEIDETILEGMVPIRDPSVMTIMISMKRIIVLSDAVIITSINWVEEIKIQVAR